MYVCEREIERQRANGEKEGECGEERESERDLS